MIFADLVAGDSVFLDANTFLYHFGPDPALGPPCSQLLQRIENQELTEAWQGVHPERFVERVLSVRETCRQQGRCLLANLTECCRAQQESKASPPLLPAKSSQLGVA